MKVLIADDELASLKIVQKIIQKWGYQVELATDGNQAWTILDSDPSIHIAVLDWMMPGIDGLEICRRLRARTEAPYVAALVLSARDSMEDVDQGYAAGADDYLIKPVNAVQLKHRLAVAERLVRIERELRKNNEVLSKLVSKMDKLPRPRA